VKKRIPLGSIIVVAFLILFVYSGSVRAAGLVEIGPSQVGSELSTGFMLTISERINNRYDFTIGYISKQDFKLDDDVPHSEWHVKEQIFAGVELLTHFPFAEKLTFGIGPYVFQRADRIGTDTFRMGLSIEYQFTPHFGVRLRHFSLAGSGPELTICRETEGWTDVPCDTPGANKQTNDWNTGQDSWLRAVWYF
jgi:hypothetical protein